MSSDEQKERKKVVAISSSNFGTSSSNISGVFQIETGTKPEENAGPPSPRDKWNQANTSELTKCFDDFFNRNYEIFHRTRGTGPQETGLAASGSMPTVSPFEPIPKELYFPKELEQLSFSVFDAHWGDVELIDLYFNEYTRLWVYCIRSGLTDHAEKIWHEALRIAEKWESAHTDCRIHKGSPFYFYAVGCIMRGDLDKGFLLMHSGFIEDLKVDACQPKQQPQGTVKDAYGKPAYCCVALEPDEKYQFFHFKVKEISNFLDDVFNEYSKEIKTGINANDFRKRFLRNSITSRDPLFLFVYSIFELKRLVKEFKSQWKENYFTPKLIMRNLSSLCLIIEDLIKEVAKRDSICADKLTYYSNCMAYLSSVAGLSVHEPNSQTKLRHVIELQDPLNEKNQLDSDKTKEILTALLSGRPTRDVHFEDDCKPLNLIEIDLRISLALRNYGAHNIADEEIITHNLNRLCQSVLNVLFFTVEALGVK